MSGLNEGLELDDELSDEQKNQNVTNVLFDNVVPGDVPDLDKDIQVVTAVAAGGDNLRYFMDDITKSQGMSKTLAMEAERIMPGFLNDDVPLAFYTEMPTSTRLKATMEAVQEAEKGLITRILESISNLVSGFLEWVRVYAKKFFNETNLAESEAVYKAKAANLSTVLEKAQDTQKKGDRTIVDIKRLLRDNNTEAARLYIEGLKDTLLKNEEGFEAIYKGINTSNELYAIATKASILDKVFLIVDNASDIVSDFTDIKSERFKRIVEAQGESKQLTAAAIGQKMEIFDSARRLNVGSLETLAISLDQSMNARTVNFDPSKQKVQDIFNNFRETFARYNAKEQLLKVGTAIDQVESLHKYFLSMVQNSAWSSKDRALKHNLLNTVIRLLFGEIRGFLKILTTASRILSSWMMMAKRMNQLADSFESKIQMHLSKLEKEEADAVRKYFGVGLESVGKTN